MRRFNLRQIEAFRSVMLTGTATRAAALLGVTQPAVSRLLADFEAQVGFSLFARRAGRLQPSPEAHALFAEIERAYVSLDHINSFIDSLRSRGNGRIAVLAAFSMAHGLLPHVIARFREEQPDLFITLGTVDRRDVREWLTAQQFDLAVTSFPVEYPAAATKRLAQVPGVCVLPEGHPLEGKASITPQDLGDYPFICTPPGSTHRFKLDRAFEGAGVRMHRVLTMEAATRAIICELVVAGLGVAVVDAVTASAFRAKGLVSRPFVPAVNYEFRLIFPLQGVRSLATERLADLIASYVEEIGYAVR